MAEAADEEVMMIGRRKVLSLLGFTPLAAKATADRAAMELTHLGGWAAPPLAVGIDSNAAPAAFGEQLHPERHTKMSSYLRFMGKLPEHVDRQVWQESKYVQHLDADLAVLKSWSLCAKVHEQRQRNYARRIEEYQDAGWYERGTKAFKEKFGFDWRS